MSASTTTASGIPTTWSPGGFGEYRSTTDLVDARSRQGSVLLLVISGADHWELPPSIPHSTYFTLWESSTTSALRGTMPLHSRLTWTRQTRADRPCVFVCGSNSPTCRILRRPPLAPPARRLDQVHQPTTTLGEIKCNADRRSRVARDHGNDKAKHTATGSHRRDPETEFNSRLDERPVHAVRPCHASRQQE